MPALFFAGLIVIVGGGVAAALLHRRSGAAAGVFVALVVAGCAMLAATAVHVLVGGDVWEIAFRSGVPGGDWAFGVDPLSAVFLLAISIVGAAASVYGAGYFRDEERREAVTVSHATVAVLLAAMALVVTSRAAVPFLMSWEVMALAGWVLIMFDHEREETRRAGLIYLAATHTATLTLIAMFAVWGGSAHELTFAALAGIGAPPFHARTAILLLGLFGFGVKAGFVPLHFWLPGAHAAAPSHVSALLSGLMIKTGIYGLLRMIALLAGAPAWFGWTLLVLGAMSGVLGVVWALAQHDIKRLLAYHSVENIGIILLGMGIGSLGAAHGAPLVAAFGYAGAILHVLNHALFKGLLFLGAGAVVRATHTRTMDALGGLARAMPVTAFTFLLGSAAIVGLPPLNGFVSEWLIALALVRAGAGSGAIRVAVVALAALGLIGALALACFAKVYGVVFLGRARSAEAASAHEVGRLLRVPMLALAAACILIGLLPVLAVPPVLAAARAVAGPLADIGGDADLAVTRLSLAASALALILLVLWGLRGALMRGRWRSVPNPWSCGYPQPTPRMQYTASSFAAPVLEPFGSAAGLHATRTAGGFATHPFDPALDGVLLPLWRRMSVAAAGLRLLQLGRLHLALLGVLATVVALLFYLALQLTP